MRITLGMIIMVGDDKNISSNSRGTRGATDEFCFRRIREMEKFRSQQIHNFTSNFWYDVTCSLLMNNSITSAKWIPEVGCHALNLVKDFSNGDFKKGRFGDGGGSFDIASVWGVESRISVSMRAIEVGESPEGSWASQERTPSV